MDLIDRIGDIEYGPAPQEAIERVKDDARSWAADDKEEAADLHVAQTDGEVPKRDCVLNSPFRELLEGNPSEFLHERAWYGVQHQMGRSGFHVPIDNEKCTLFGEFGAELCVLFLEEYQKHVPDSVASRMTEGDREAFRPTMYAYFEVE